MTADFETNVSMLAEMGSQFPYKRNFRTVTGRYDTTTGLLQADPTSGLPAGWVWVMLQYGRMSVPAIAGVDTSRPGLPVWCGYNEGGSLCAWGAILSEETAVQFGGQLPALITPTAPAQQSNTPYAGALLDDLRLRWANAAGEPGGLYVTLDAGWIGGLYAYLQPQIALVPTATSAASAWCVVCADRRDGSLSQFLLVDQFGSYTPTPASIAALSSAVIPGYLRAVGAVILTNGDTSLSGKMIVSMRDLTETRIKANTGAAVDPTSTDDETTGYEFGSVWWNSTGSKLWLCVDATATSANWIQINGGGSPSPLTTKGDVYTYSSTNARLPIGSDGQVLMVDSTATTGNKWGAIPTVGGAATVLDVDTTTVGNIGGGTDDLIVFSVPGNTLANNGEYLHGVMSGSYAGNANTKTLAVVFGSTSLFSTGALSVLSAADWTLEYWIYRIGASSQLAVVEYTSSFGTLSADATVTAVSETLSGALTLKATGAGTSTNDITQKVLHVEKWSLGSSSVVGSYILLQEQQTSGTDGGTFTSGSWQTRLLNTEVVDTNNDCTLASHQFTLIAGTYRLKALAPGYIVALNSLRLYDITNSAEIARGRNAYAAASRDEEATATLECRFTAAGTTTYELQHQCSATSATQGFGIANSFGTEIYAEVVITKE